MTPQVFSNITPERWEKLKVSAAQALGAPLTADSGELSQQGVDATYAYADNTLTVTPKKKPFFISEGFLDGKLSDWVNSIQ